MMRACVPMSTWPAAAWIINSSSCSRTIDKASGDEKTKLEALREKLLDFTNEMDKQLEARYKQAQEFVESLLAQDDVVQAVQDNLDRFTQDAVDVVNQMLRQASEKNDYTRMGKLQKMVEVLRDASTPPEVSFIEQLLDAPDDAALEKMLNDNADLINDQFMEALIGLVAQVDQAAEQGNPEAKALSEKLSKVYKTALEILHEEKHVIKEGFRSGTLLSYLSMSFGTYVILLYRDHGYPYEIR